jgi:hypothetical protein
MPSKSSEQERRFASFKYWYELGWFLLGIRSALLYSGELSDGQLYGAVRVMNPFQLDIAP